MSFPAYPSYRDSGIEWLGHVPAHWSIDRIKASVESARNGIWGGEPEEADEDIICVRVADFDRVRFIASIDAPTMRKVTEKERKGRQLQCGDLLLEKSGGGEKQPVGAVVQYAEDVPAVCSNFVARVQLKPGMHSRFWTYVHAAAYSVRLTQGSINQTSGIQNLDSGRYFEERAPFPPLPEQTAIAAFLDRETAKIDALVEEQRRLIELLKEKRQAVISHAVTKGLDPSVPMKGSGVEWLGEVPAHWEVARLTHLWANVKAGPFGSAITKDMYVSSGYRVYGQEQVIPGDFTIGDYYISEERFEELRQYEVQPLDILISCVGTFGKIALVPDSIERGIINPRLIRIRSGARVCPEYLCVLLRSGISSEQLSAFSRGGTMDVINIGVLGSLVLPVPPIDEQPAIVRAVTELKDRFAALSAEAARSIDLLLERRAALISAAVTGKIDVRAISADLRELAAA
ncbi:restriction endonuclease subunit S [Sphingobium bisphenolivorans]|uniref:restriction endonuclease subunit S n=1 Tax=Sphingobium bisphenolivorans TaxID=1335760 RepID=UPI0003A5ECBC|nr:restriction endonuclease subunit S [Sphingobium bisphenolivorans]